MKMTTVKNVHRSPLIWSAREEHRTESTAFLASLLGMSKSKVVRRLQKAIDKAKQKGM